MSGTIYNMGEAYGNVASDAVNVSFNNTGTSIPDNNVDGALKTLDGNLGSSQFKIEDGQIFWREVGETEWNFFSSKSLLLAGVVSPYNARMTTNTPIITRIPVDVKPYKRIQFTYENFTYYDETWYMGIIDKENPTITECKTSPYLYTVRHSRTGRDEYVTKTHDMDITNIFGKFTVFIIREGAVYSYVNRVEMFKD